MNKQPPAQDLLGRVSRILTQQPKDKHKLYALHAPDEEFFSNGKAAHPRFGVKVRVATTLKEGLVVGVSSMPGNPWEGYTLEKPLIRLAS